MDSMKMERLVSLLFLPHTLLFLTLNEICVLECVCTDFLRRSRREMAKKRCLRQCGGGVPARLRVRYWSWIAGVEMLFSRNKDSLVMLYTRCVLGGADFPLTASPSLSRASTTIRRGLGALRDQGVQGEILRDISRTYPRRPMFDPRKSKGQDALADILRAVATYDPVCGYCQGMNYVCATLLTAVAESEYQRREASKTGSTLIALADTESSKQNGEEGENELDDDPRSPRVYLVERDDALEATVFGLMMALIHNFDMRDLWRPGVPQLKLRIYQFDRILALKLPHLHNHFRKIGLSPDFFASQWFLTLLAYNLSHKDLVRAWDILFTDGWKTIFRIGLAILSSVDSILINLSMEDTARFFRSKKGTGGEILGNLFDQSSNSNCRKEEDIVKVILKYKVSTRILIEMERDYVQHVLQQQLSDKPDNHGLIAFIDRRVASQVRDEISMMDGNVREDVKILRAKVETAEALLRAANYAFEVAAREYSVIQVELEELLEAKQAIIHQITALVTLIGSTGAKSSKFRSYEDDIRALQGKIQGIETQIMSHSHRFGTVLKHTTQAQVDLDEALERKHAYSEFLHRVLQRNEEQNTITLLRIFREYTTSANSADSTDRRL